MPRFCLSLALTINISELSHLRLLSICDWQIAAFYLPAVDKFEKIILNKTNATFKFECFIVAMDAQRTVKNTMQKLRTHRRMVQLSILPYEFGCCGQIWK